MTKLKEILGSDKVKGVICVAGGWAGGNAASDSKPCPSFAFSTQQDAFHCFVTPTPP
jgi:hypothetical protein